MTTDMVDVSAMHEPHRFAHRCWHAHCPHVAPEQEVPHATFDARLARGQALNPTGALRALVVAGLCVGAGARAQSTTQEEQKDAELRPIDVVRTNLERSYLVYPITLSGLGPLVLESNMVSHFIVHRPSWPAAIVLSPKIVVRMLQERSVPVHSPSFKPQLAVFTWFQPRWAETPWLYASLALVHHSNGMADPLLYVDGRVNEATGSFATNYVVAALHVTARHNVFMSWNRIALEVHPALGEAAALQGRYGMWRLQLASRLVTMLPLHGYLDLELGAILDGMTYASSVPALRVLEHFPLSVSYSMTAPGIDLGLFARYYVGHDYYNVYFERVVQLIELGISGGFSASW